MARISDIINSLTLIGIFTVLLLCYRRFCETEDIQKLRMKAQHVQELAQAEMERGQEKQWRAIQDQIQALSDTARTQRSQLETQEQELHLIQLEVEMRRRRDEGYNKIIGLLAPGHKNDIRTDSRGSKH